MIALGSLGGASAEARTSCKAGATRYEAQGVRMFEITKRDSHGEEYQVLLACRTGSTRPVVLYVGSHGGTTVAWHTAEREGTRVIWQIEEFADGGGAMTIGWFSARSGTFRAGDVEWKFGRPLATAVAPDGGIAVVTDGVQLGGSGQSVLYLAPGRRRLRTPRVLVESIEGVVVPESLRVRLGVATWTTQAGVNGSAPVR